MKKIIILKHGGGELANQLWNYISVYAYGLESKALVQNPSFFEYHPFFNFLPKEKFTTRILSFFFKKPRRRTHVINRIARFKYSVYVKIMKLLHNGQVISSENNENKVFYLPPTTVLSENIVLDKALYMTGWLFRNPLGLEKFSHELHTAFTPNTEVLKSVSGTIEQLRKKYTHIIGVHIRQSDYKNFKGGKFLLDQKRVAQILREYVHIKSFNVEQTVFLITSDGAVDPTTFSDLCIYISKENFITDLFVLSQTDAIIGSNSSFGAFASWYGDIPHIVMSNEEIDWNYYQDRQAFFANKYLTLAHF